MKKRLSVSVFILFLLMFSASVSTAEMFPSTSVVRQKCAACHKSDPQGSLDVIEETRKSPEEWKNVIIRMIRLNSAPIKDADIHPLVKDLSMQLCLTPDEMSKVAYYNSDENSQYREIPKDDVETRLYTACVRCHTFAKITSHRNTEAQWDANRDLHLGYYPTVVPQMREMNWPKESKDLVPILAGKLPFKTAAWEKWNSGKKEQDLSGKWTTAGYQPGMGYYTGSYTFTADADKGKDEYIIKRTINYLSGFSLTMHGTASLYGTYHLRYALAPTALTGRIEGVFDLDAETMGFTGKWWTTIQDTNAYGNEAFHKEDGKARVIAAFPNALKADDAAEQTLTVAGVALPGEITPAAITFSNEGVKVSAVTMKDGVAVCSLKVGKNVPAGPVTLTVKGTAYADPILIYDKIDGIQVLPRIGRARVSSGPAYPPQGVQFIARAVNFGADGKPDTADDMILEPVDAEWGLTEEVTREGDDDIKYLKTSIANGLYTPVTTYGPIEERVQRREGVGLIAVTAKYEEFESKAKLAVTVPDFIPNIK